MVETSSTVGGGKIPPCHFLHFTLTFYHLKVRIVNPALPIRPVDSFLFLVIIIFSSFFGPRVRLSWLQQSSTGRMQITVYHTVSYRVVSLQIHSRERQIRHLVGWLFLGVSAWIFMRAPCRACVAGRGRTLAVRCRGCSDTCRWSRDARSTRTHDLSSSSHPRSTQTDTQRRGKSRTTTWTHTKTYSWPFFFIAPSIYTDRHSNIITHKPMTHIATWTHSNSWHTQRRSHTHTHDPSSSSHPRSTQTDTQRHSQTQTHDTQRRSHTQTHDTQRRGHTQTHDLYSSADDRSWQTRSTSLIVFTVSGRYLDSQNLDSEIPWRYMDRYYRVKVRVGVSYDCPAYDCPDFDCTDFDR